MSPNSLASLMRSPTSRRRTVSRWTQLLLELGLAFGGECDFLLHALLPFSVGSRSATGRARTVPGSLKCPREYTDRTPEHDKAGDTPEGAVGRRLDDRQRRYDSRRRVASSDWLGASSSARFFGLAGLASSSFVLVELALRALADGLHRLAERSCRAAGSWLGPKRISTIDEDDDQLHAAGQSETRHGASSIERPRDTGVPARPNRAA